MTYEDFRARLKTRVGRGYATQLLGQAGVWAVAAQLAIRGHIPLFPGVDHGYDIMLDNGLRLQVKARTLAYNKMFKKEVYSFDVCGAKWDNASKKLRKVTAPYYRDKADFYVFWGVDENRFWIVPTADVKTMMYIARRSSDIVTEGNPGRWHHEQKMQRLQKMEDRWDLLSIDRVVEQVEQETVASDTTSS